MNILPWDTLGRMGFISIDTGIRYGLGGLSIIYWTIFDVIIDSREVIILLKTRFVLRTKSYSIVCMPNLKHIWKRLA